MLTAHVCSNDITATGAQSDAAKRRYDWQFTEQYLIIHTHTHTMLSERLDRWTEQQPIRYARVKHTMVDLVSLHRAVYILHTPLFHLPYRFTITQYELPHDCCCVERKNKQTFLCSLKPIVDWAISVQNQRRSRSRIFLGFFFFLRKLYVIWNINERTSDQFHNGQ